MQYLFTGENSVVVLDNTIQFKVGDQVPCPKCGTLDTLRDTTEWPETLDDAINTPSTGLLWFNCEELPYPILWGLGNYPIVDQIEWEPVDWLPTLEMQEWYEQQVWN